MIAGGRGRAGDAAERELWGMQLWRRPLQAAHMGAEYICTQITSVFQKFAPFPEMLQEPYLDNLFHFFK